MLFVSSSDHPVGNRTKLTYPDASVVTYTYDALNRLLSIDNQQSSIVNFTYDALSRRASLALANGTSTTYQYDAINRLLHLIGSGSLGTRDYTYDELGNRQTLTDPAGLHTNTYDPLSQLTAVDYPTGFAFSDTSFTYDTVGNRTQVGSTAYLPNSLNQYTVVRGQSLPRLTPMLHLRMVKGGNWRWGLQS